TLDPKKAYVEALVVRRLLQQIWGGFDSPTAYVECLCTALNVWTNGCSAISRLKGCQAFDQCILDNRSKRCDQLRTQTVDEVLLTYDRLCPDNDCKDPHERDHGCGCGCHDDGDGEGNHDSTGTQDGVSSSSGNDGDHGSSSLDDDDEDD